MSEGREALLDLRGVRKSFRDVCAVDGVDLRVLRGEVFGLLGPNGAGKTTLIRMILDIVRPDAGEVRVFGHPLERADLDRIGYLPEERGLYRKRKVIQVLRYLAELKGVPRPLFEQRVGPLLVRLSLADAAGRRVETLSKGNQQKVQLIATLLGEPELLVWDEPFSGLDPVNVREVRDLIRSQAERGATVILSTHLMDQAEQLCDRVALVNNGQIVLQGAVDVLLDDHAELVPPPPPQPPRPSLEELFVHAVRR